jgi:hypothetical protein
LSRTLVDDLSASCISWPSGGQASPAAITIVEAIADHRNESEAIEVIHCDLTTHNPSNLITANESIICPT